MAKRTRTNRLNLWMNGLPVGYWESTRGEESLVYWDDWIRGPGKDSATLS